jgi:hypothetical protein
MSEREKPTAEVAPLNLSDEPDLPAVLHTTTNMLGSEANSYCHPETNLPEA